MPDQPTPQLSSPAGLDLLRGLIEKLNTVGGEMLTIAIVAGQCSVEGADDAKAGMAAAEAERASRWSDVLREVASRLSALASPALSGISPAQIGQPLCRCQPGECLLHPTLTTCSMRSPRSESRLAAIESAAHEATAKMLVDWAVMIEQFCRDLNAAHDEILRAQGVASERFNNFDWPEWSGPANSIRWAERTLGKRLSKTSLRGRKHE